MKHSSDLHGIDNIAKAIPASPHYKTKKASPKKKVAAKKAPKAKPATDVSYAPPQTPAVDLTKIDRVRKPAAPRTPGYVQTTLPGMRNTKQFK
ncbi:hypothetical protein UFOVP965_121 [uncultured Caudovirales phage]|uniref:Uncharacterized protein n=1 Tax=uncultured Caudovirales phage TaxID=2100421 RepID=A0A6J5QYA7_9CAUD|nr:hypothetical protein UFOVP965_121 [uncultured Caudovirales phage]CAB4179910.1 hypothetical protein UFOVP1035_117 [uncultured Caudovirales phage]CAB4188742.1 hypothetical protein UFOVP1181_76 [uncultured Caudovirales phage]